MIWLHITLQFRKFLNMKSHIFAEWQNGHSKLGSIPDACGLVHIGHAKTCPAHAVHDYITAKTNWLFLATEWLPQLQAFNANRWFIHTLVVTVSRILVARWPRQLTLWYKLSLPTIFSAWLHATRVTVFIKWYIIYTNTLFAVNTQQWVSGNQDRQLMFTGRNWIAHSDIAPRASVIICVCAWTMVCIYCTLHLMGCILELCKVLCFPGW